MWFQNHAPSLVVEIVSGCCCVALALLSAWLARPLVGLIGVATVLSLFYERELDRNGFSWSDVAQRQLGIFAAALLWHII